MRHLTILLPFGLPPVEMAADLLRELRAPALATLLARAKSGESTNRNERIDDFTRALPHEIWLAREFGIAGRLKQTGSPAIASALMQTLGLKADDGDWFILQPVHIHVARDHLVLTDPRQLALSEHEARTLFDIAEPLFAETGKTLLYGDAATWFVRAEDWAELQTSTPDATAGHNIDIWMAKGSGERDWRKLQNEVQMHWFDDPVNVNRESRGLTSVNSIWIWGGAPAVMEQAPNRYTDVFNLSGPDRAYRQFVARHGEARSASALFAAQPASALTVLDDMLVPALTSDWASWLYGMHALEENWFAPLLAGLKSGTLEQLSLVLTGDARIRRYDLSKSSLRKFWVKSTLASLSS